MEEAFNTNVAPIHGSHNAKLKAVEIVNAREQSTMDSKTQSVPRRSQMKNLQAILVLSKCFNMDLKLKIRTTKLNATITD